jgi:hypothetical protein
MALYSFQGKSMTTHPYISGPGNISQMIGFLRKNFPATVTSETVKKLGLASNNESYVINALQFLGLIDEEGKRTDRGQAVLATHEDGAFNKAFEGLVKEAYKDLFEIRGDDAWKMSKSELISYFRSVDKTSDVIGTRQAGVFQTLRSLTGREPLAGAKAAGASKQTAKSSKPKTAKSEGTKSSTAFVDPPDALAGKKKKEMALTVRVEINLPAEASAETYDNIFKSIKANLLNE